jgi:hypothetical protein
MEYATGKHGCGCFLQKERCVSVVVPSSLSDFANLSL